MTKIQREKNELTKKDRMIARERENIAVFLSVNIFHQNFSLLHFFIIINWVLNKLCNKYLHQLHEITFNKWTNDIIWAWIFIYRGRECHQDLLIYWTQWSNDLDYLVTKMKDWTSVIHSSLDDLVFLILPHQRRGLTNTDLGSSSDWAQLELVEMWKFGFYEWIFRLTNLYQGYGYTEKDTSGYFECILVWSARMRSGS